MARFIFKSEAELISVLTLQFAIQWSEIIPHNKPFWVPIQEKTQGYPSEFELNSSEKENVQNLNSNPYTIFEFSRLDWI